MARLELGDAPALGDDELRSWGRVLCVAPHPDDESLGCGGTLARLSSLGQSVGVVWVSDGAGSHPNSIEYAPPRLARLREGEAREAAARLGLRGELFFMGLPDGALPFPGEDGFLEACAQARGILEAFEPATLLLPWRRDPHRDHRAAWTMWASAAQAHGRDALCQLEYLVWAFERAAQNEWPDQSEARALRVSIQGFAGQKRAAIEAHASQTTHLINDDPTGFWLSPEVLAHFEAPFEAFIAPFDCRPQSGTAAAPDFQNRPA